MAGQFEFKEDKLSKAISRWGLETMMDEVGFFQETVNQYIKWGIILGFLYFCYKNANVRVFGFLVGAVGIVAGLVREFITTPGADNGEVWASALIVLGVCSFAHFSSRK